jgi:hypothetical protein
MESSDTDQVQLKGVLHVWQKWNNCGPSAVLMALSAFGIVRDQLGVAADLKPDREDTNVTPDELAAYARRQGVETHVGYAGNRDIARALLRVGVPVIVEQWIDVRGRGEMGHYRVLIGYDDRESAFIVQDSYYGANRHYAYDEFEQMWRPFGGVYIVLYVPQQAAGVQAAIGGDWDEGTMWRRSLAEHEAWVTTDPGSAWAWLTLGEVRSRLGDHAGAVVAIDRAIAIGLPWRTFWYQFGYYRSLIALGLYDRAIAQADATIATMKGENLEESHYWRGVALYHLGRLDDARASFERALAFNPRYAPAEQALAGQLPD